MVCTPHPEACVPKSCVQPKLPYSAFVAKFAVFMGWVEVD